MIILTRNEQAAYWTPIGVLCETIGNHRALSFFSWSDQAVEEKRESTLWCLLLDTVFQWVSIRATCSFWVKIIMSRSVYPCGASHKRRHLSVLLGTHLVASADFRAPLGVTPTALFFSCTDSRLMYLSEGSWSRKRQWSVTWPCSA